jgi:hypothetical protein
MISLSDKQLQAVMAAAKHLRQEDREEFLRLVATQLKPRMIDVNDSKRALRFFQERGLFTCDDT